MIRYDDCLKLGCICLCMWKDQKSIHRFMLAAHCHPVNWTCYLFPYKCTICPQKPVKFILTKSPKSAKGLRNILNVVGKSIWRKSLYGKFLKENGNMDGRFPLLLIINRIGRTLFNRLLGAWRRPWSWTCLLRLGLDRWTQRWKIKYHIS